MTSIAKAKPLDATMQQILQDEGAIQTQDIGIEYRQQGHHRMSLTSDLPALPSARSRTAVAAARPHAGGRRHHRRWRWGCSACWLGPVSKPPPRNPFGMGLREATPSGSLGAWILSVQSGFYGSLQAGVPGDEARTARRCARSSSSASPMGSSMPPAPGHGKGVISAYLVADEKALRKGFALSLAAALVQALVAIAIVSRRDARAARHRRHHEQARR